MPAVRLLRHSAQTRYHPYRQIPTNNARLTLITDYRVRNENRGLSDPTQTDVEMEDVTENVMANINLFPGHHTQRLLLRRQACRVIASNSGSRFKFLTDQMDVVVEYVVENAENIAEYARDVNVLEGTNHASKIIN